MNENVKNICKICNEEKKNVKSRRYPSLFNKNYCDECYDDLVKEDNKASKKFLSIIFGVMLVAFILDFFVKIEGIPFAMTLLAYCILTIIFLKVNVFNSIISILLEATFLAFIFDDDYQGRNSSDVGSLFTVFIVVLFFAIRMLLFFLVILLAIIKFINTTLILKNVEEKTRLIILTICYLLFASAATGAIILFIKLI